MANAEKEGERGLNVWIYLISIRFYFRINLVSFWGDGKRIFTLFLIILVSASRMLQMNILTVTLNKIHNMSRN